MNSIIFDFLRKFIAGLYLNGVETIPFAGEEFDQGVTAVMNEAEKSINPEEYDKISEIFMKTPVQEEYGLFRDKMMALNGDVIGFSSVKNPYWEVMDIKMSEYYARKVLADHTFLDIDEKTMFSLTDEFCKAAGVVSWGA